MRLTNFSTRPFSKSSMKRTMSSPSSFSTRFSKNCKNSKESTARSSFEIALVIALAGSTLANSSIRACRLLAISEEPSNTPFFSKSRADLKRPFSRFSSPFNRIISGSWNAFAVGIGRSVGITDGTGRSRNKPENDPSPIITTMNSSEKKMIAIDARSDVSLICPI